MCGGACPQGRRLSHGKTSGAQGQPQRESLPEQSPCYWSGDGMEQESSANGSLPGGEAPGPVETKRGVSAWPATLEKRIMPDEADTQHSSQAKSFSSEFYDMPLLNGTPSIRDVSADEVAEMFSKTFSSRHSLFGSFILHPNSNLCVAIDLVTCLVLSYDLVETPFVIAWASQFEETTSVGALISLVYWTLDLGLHFRTGFYRRGELELRPRAIARRYLRGTFVLDASIVAVGWARHLITLYHVASGGSLWRVSSLTKMMRILRLHNVRRLSRCMEPISRIPNEVLSKVVHNVVSMVLLLMLIIWVNHVLACAVRTDRGHVSGPAVSLYPLIFQNC